MALHLSPACDISSIRDIANINVDILVKMIQLSEDHVSLLEKLTLEQQRAKEDFLRKRFSILLSFILQHGLEAVEIANKLGTTVSTVHRWASGSFVPKQFFVHVAVLKSVLELLRDQKSQIQNELTKLTVDQSFLDQDVVLKYGHIGIAR